MTKQALQLLTTLRPKTVYSLHHLDTCTTDYFSGHHLPVAQVLVDVGSMEDDDMWELYMYFVIETLGEDDE